MAQPAAILLLLVSSAQGQVQAPDKAYIEQIPRNLRPAIALPAPAQRAPAATPSAAQAGPVAQPPSRPAPEIGVRTASSAPPPAARPAAAPQPSGGTCQIRAGTFSQRANADNLAKALKPMGDVRVNAMQLGGKPVHLVTIVGLQTRKNAELALARLKASGKDLGALSISGCRT